MFAPNLSDSNEYKELHEYSKKNSKCLLTIRTRRSCLMKKIEREKSRDTVPLKVIEVK
jgi:hypothetical protein